jgi:hypothetical protein
VAWRPQAGFCDAFDTLTSLTSRYVSSTKPSELHNGSHFDTGSGGKGFVLRATTSDVEQVCRIQVTASAMAGRSTHVS